MSMAMQTETFLAIDKNHSGSISAEELRKAYEKLITTPHQNSEETVQMIMDSVDFDKNGSINYTEFLTGTLDLDVLFK